jgi:hypothetical protein
MKVSSQALSCSHFDHASMLLSPKGSRVILATSGKQLWSQIFILFFELFNIDAHKDHLLGKPNFTSFLFVVEEICLDTRLFSQWGQLRFFCVKVFCWISFHVSSTKFSNILSIDSSCKTRPFYTKNSKVELPPLESIYKLSFFQLYNYFL